MAHPIEEMFVFFKAMSFINKTTVAVTVCASFSTGQQQEG